MSDVTTPRSEVTTMRARAAVCQVVDGGTVSMRAAGKTYLPKWPLEDEKDWEARCALSVLTPHYSEALDTMVGKPFGEPIQLGEDVPARVREALENADLLGSDLDTFTREWFRLALRDGACWAVVDYPAVAPGLTAAQERDAGARPYLILVPLASVVSWSTEMVNGRPVLKEFRYTETVEAVDGFGIVTKTRVRRFVKVDGRVQSEVYVDGNLFGSPVPLAKMDEIPVAFWAPQRTGYMSAVPPLENLAWLNVQHWQSASDQRNILHVVRVPLLAADEDNRSDPDSKVKASSNGIIVGLPNLRYVEHTGAAIDAGRQDLVDLEERMRLVAGRVLTRQAGGDKSASEATLEARDGGSKLKQWARSFQDTLEEAMRLMAKWCGEAKGGTVTVFTGWSDMIDPQMFQFALAARQAREISRETFLGVAAKAGLLENVEDEAHRLETEGPEDFGTGTGMEKL